MHVDSILSEGKPTLLQPEETSPRVGPDGLNQKRTAEYDPYGLNEIVVEADATKIGDDGESQGKLDQNEPEISPEKVDQILHKMSEAPQSKEIVDKFKALDNTIMAQEEQIKRSLEANDVLEEWFGKRVPDKNLRKITKRDNAEIDYAQNNPHRNVYKP